MLPHDENVTIKSDSTNGVAATPATSAQLPSIPELRRLFGEQLIAPSDPEYDKARTPFYGGIDRRPAAIIRPTNDNEVARVVALARESGAELAIRSGGHSFAGYSVSEGGIVLDLSAMRDLQIDPEARTAWAEAGLTTGEYTEAAGAHGLATGFGDTGSVGIGGITLGGGTGFLSRKYGLTIDDLLAADIVTADGQILRVDADNHPDLFWAIRGGGGNFGVVTRFKFRLHEVDQIVGGLLILPATPETITAFIAESEAAPEELTSIANVMVAPPMPFVPAEHHGKLVLLAIMVYAGPAGEGERVLAPFRAITTPLSDMLQPMPYVRIYEEEGEEFHPMGAGRTFFMDKVDQRDAETILDYINASNAMMKVAQLRVLGGAVARVPAGATAYAHRQRRIMANVAALYMNPAEAEQHEAWVASFAAALAQGEPAAYVNFLGATDGPARMREAYPGDTWERLMAIKRRYDPTNLFRMNHNIPADDPQ